MKYAEEIAALKLHIKQLEWRIRLLEEPKELDGEAIMGHVYTRVKKDWGFISKHLIRITDERRKQDKYWKWLG